MPTYGVMFRKKGSDGAYGFTNPVGSQALAARVASNYRKLGYDAIDVAYPT